MDASAAAFGADSPEVVPGGEGLNGLPHFVGESVELRVDPLLGSGQIGITLGEKAVMLQQSPQMLGRLAGNAVESLV